MDVSVVVPIHNAARHIPALLESLDQLRGDAIEFVLIDDHSTDDGVALLDAWTPAHGRRKVILTASDRGVASARNQAVAAASGEYLWFTDADDTWSAEIVEAQLRVARAGGHDMVVCNALRVEESSGSQRLLEDATEERIADGPTVLGSLLRGEVQGHLWNKLVRRTLFTDAKFPPTRAHSDLGGLLQLVAHARTVAFLPRTLYTYKVHAGSVLHSSTYRWDDLPDVLAIAQRVVAELDAPGLGKRDLAVFAARYVWLPLAHEAIRRGKAGGPAAEGAPAAWRRARRGLQWRYLVALVEERNVGTAARGAAMKAVPWLYAPMYSSWRQRRWTGLDRQLAAD